MVDEARAIQPKDFLGFSINHDGRADVAIFLCSDHAGGSCRPLHLSPKPIFTHLKRLDPPCRRHRPFEAAFSLVCLVFIIHRQINVVRYESIDHRFRVCEGELATVTGSCATGRQQMHPCRNRASGVTRWQFLVKGCEM